MEPTTTTLPPPPVPATLPPLLLLAAPPPPPPPIRRSTAHTVKVIALTVGATMLVAIGAATLFVANQDTTEAATVEAGCPTGSHQRLADGPCEADGTVPADGDVFLLAYGPAAADDQLTLVSLSDLLYDALGDEHIYIAADKATDIARTYTRLGRTADAMPGRYSPAGVTVANMIETCGEAFTDLAAALSDMDSAGLRVANAEVTDCNDANDDVIALMSDATARLGG